MASSASQRVTLTNTGDLPLTVSSIAAIGDFSQTNNYTGPLAPGAACHVDVVFTPTAQGARAGNLAIASNGSGSPLNVALSGNGIPAVLPRVSINGNQFVDPSGAPIRLKSVNWFGAESTNYTPHGTWARRYTSIVDQIAGWGFNCIRLAFSGDFCASGRTIPGTAFDASLNPEFVGKLAIEVLDLIIAYCRSKSIYVVLDHHRRQAGAGADGSPVDGAYIETQWRNDWVFLANRYKDDTTVVGGDLHNEPHDLTWDAWATYAEGCGNAILAAAPQWLIFVEGVGAIGSDNYWWGGQLKGVATRPVVLSVANKVAYSPHEYGQSVGSQNWLAYDGSTPPSGWPNNLYAVWRAYWGYIFEDNIAPIWIGEFGGKYGLDGNGATGTVPNGAYESQWTTNLVKYLNGDFNGDGTRDLATDKKGVSFAYWSFNPNSGDTGGLVRDDWITPQTPKLTLINPLLV